jgi:hypothetical protein
VDPSRAAPDTRAVRIIAADEAKNSQCRRGTRQEVDGDRLAAADQGVQKVLVNVSRIRV